MAGVYQPPPARRNMLDREQAQHVAVERRCFRTGRGSADRSRAMLLHVRWRFVAMPPSSSSNSSR